jgi:membrane protein involved in colicin uptake
MSQRVARLLAALALCNSAVAWAPSLRISSKLGQRKTIKRWGDPNISDLKKQQRDLEVEERQLEIRAKIESLQRLKRQGKAYDGSKASPREGQKAKDQYANKLDAVSEAIQQQTMTSAESFFSKVLADSAAGLKTPPVIAPTTAVAGASAEATVLAAADAIETAARAEAQAKAQAVAASAQADLNPIMAAAQAAAAASKKALAAPRDTFQPSASAEATEAAQPAAAESAAPPPQQGSDFEKTTSGIGGNWKPNAEIIAKTHKPITSGYGTSPASSFYFRPFRYHS